jgi:hypothetical protein
MNYEGNISLKPCAYTRLFNTCLTFSFLTATSTGILQCLKPVFSSVPATASIHSIGSIVLGAPALFFMLRRRMGSGPARNAGSNGSRSAKSNYKCWGAE